MENLKHDLVCRRFCLFFKKKTSNYRENVLCYLWTAQCIVAQSSYNGKPQFAATWTSLGGSLFLQSCCSLEAAFCIHCHAAHLYGTCLQCPRSPKSYPAENATSVWVTGTSYLEQPWWYGQCLWARTWQHSGMKTFFWRGAVLQRQSIVDRRSWAQSQMALIKGSLVAGKLCWAPREPLHCQLWTDGIWQFHNTWQGEAVTSKTEAATVLFLNYII